VALQRRLRRAQRRTGLNTRRASEMEQPTEAFDPVRPGETALYTHRFERYQHYGLSEMASHLLAATRSADGFYLDHHYVKRCLDGGATEAQLLDWLA
jgi:hypothetical protein